MTEPVSPEIRLVPLSRVPIAAIAELMNDERVGRHLPLLRGPLSLARCRAFVEAKQRLWDEHGFGPWGFWIQGEFAGWGGLQPEHGEADFALVLHPRFWGWGRRIFEEVKRRAFGQWGLDSITILLPPTRLNAAVVKRLGFESDGEVDVEAERFLRFRLFARAASAPRADAPVTRA